jgi:RNA polymerase sigma-70 factor (ECF subfamily)
VELLRTQQDRIYNLCFQVLRHAQDAEDAAQKVLLKLVEGIGALPDVTALRRWLYRVCVTTALDLLTERSRRRAREREVALMRQTGTAPQPEGEGDLLAAIGSLDVEVGDLLVRHYFEKATLKELATEQRVSEVAIWKRIEKGKGRLRELLTTQTPALSMAALDIRLSSIVPARAPAALAAVAVAAKAGAGATLGGIAMAAKTGSTAKIVAACIGLLAAVLGGAIYVQGARARQEALEARDQAAPAAAQHRSSDPRIATAPASTPAVTAASIPAAVATPSAAVDGSSDTALREKLRTVIRLNLQMKRRVKPDPGADAEARKEMMAIMSEVGPVLQSPSKDPALFARYTRLSFEVMFEELGAPMAESQKATIAVAVERLRVQLEQFQKDPAQDRWVSELKGYRELIAGMKSLTDEQLGKLSEITSPAYMFPVTGTEIVVLDRVGSPAVEVAREWSKKYQLDEAQKTVAGTAARSFVDAWEQVDRRFEAQYGRRPAALSAGQPVGSFMDQTSIVVDYAVLTLEAQREALRLLEGALTPEQLNRMQNTPMSQFLRAGPVVGAPGTPQ